MKCIKVIAAAAAAAAATATAAAKHNVPAFSFVCFLLVDRGRDEKKG
jgi:hypothetical protein